MGMKGGKAPLIEGERGPLTDAGVVHVISALQERKGVATCSACYADEWTVARQLIYSRFWHVYMGFIFVVVTCDECGLARLFSASRLRSEGTMNILVCGGRGYNDAARIARTLDAVKERFRIDGMITGGAPGADSLAGAWGHSNHIPVMNVHPDWRKYGKNAGPIRNQQMLDEQKFDFVIAFPGGGGTADMVRRTKKAGLPILRIADLFDAEELDECIGQIAQEVADRG